MITYKNILDNLKLKIDNSYFLNYIFPNKKQISTKPNNNYDNAIKHIKIINYGDTGSGKTNVSRSLVEKAIEKYGIENVNAIESDSIENALLYGLDDKQVQFQVIEDFTLKEEDKSVLRSYFKIRHIWKKNNSISNGLIISMFNIHRFHSSLVEIRSTANAMIVRSDSINPYDHSHILKMIGTDGVYDLRILEEYREQYIDLKSLSLYKTRGGLVGMIKLPLAKINYLKNVKDSMTNLSGIDRIIKRQSVLFGTNLIINKGVKQYD